MLSSDRSELRADHRHRPAAGTYNDDLRDGAQPFDPDAPWDDVAAEALTRLCESDEGRLSRPAAGNRARVALPHTVDGEPEPEDGVDRAWLEAHLRGLAERLQQAVAQANPDATLAALNGRLETIEQRFGATLGRVAQRADLDGLRAIETRVLELAAQLEQTREGLDRIGAIDEEVRTLARKVEEAGAQRTSGLEKLLRDCIAEWREGEQRTASALQHIEEALGRLGETVDAMEASKPAPDLAMPPLTGTELGHVAGANGAFHADDAPASAPGLYRATQSTLDAADYAPKPFVAEAPAESPLPTAEAKARQVPLDWLPAAGGEGARPADAKLTPGALRIMALRAKLRQSNGGGRGTAPSYVPPGAVGEPRHSTLKRASLSVLLMAGAALVASSTYYLYQTFVVTAPASPAGVKSDLADPAGRQPKGKGAS
jgi:hypothetical protein